MTVNRRAKPKNDSATEAARVLRVFDGLREEIARRLPYDLDNNTVLEIADRIAARTEDPQ